MARVKLKFPSENPLYITEIPLRIGDINYGGHMGNDAVLSLIHEARMRMLRQWGYDELNAGGVALIMADVMIAYKGEGFYGDTLRIAVYADDVTDRSFDLMYHISAERNGARTDIVHAKTGMVCFDYKERKIALITENLKKYVTGLAK
ncbi:acyl-CoA thioesterase [Chitinophagaceae bacterium MMS25-I14]